MTSQLEALIAIGIFFVIMLIALVVILLFAIREQRVESQQHMLKLSVIVDSLIEIVTQTKYGTDEENE